MLFSGLLFFTSSGFAQSTNISGVVNTYHKVIEVIPAQACVRVSSTTGLALNQPVMLIQMKGASVSTSNSATFGDTTSLNNAGNYELGTICEISGDSVFLFHTILNSYLVSGKVQLVGIPQYYSAVVVDTVKASPWNNTTGTGGVIALSVTENLTLNAPIYADSSGFRGGSYLLQTNCNNITPSTGYIYDASNTGSFTYGSYKGESIFDLSASMTGGRGAPANGGGGGNNHNNGGGGGANLSVGGMGGGNSSTTGCTGNFRGLAGKALSSWSGKKIFFGGGGGAGHVNGGLAGPVGGGNGGGIIFILANNLIGNSKKISANGGIGGAAISDGASGGGGGGTIIMQVLSSYIGSVTIEANGGNGGNTNDGGNAGRCYGAGGGGSGGVIYFNGSTPAVTISAAAGAAGLEIGRDVAGCAAAQLPAAGVSGSTIAGYSYKRSTNPAGSCSLVLPVRLVYFDAVLNRQIVSLDWKVDYPELAEAFIIEKFIPYSGWKALDTVKPANAIYEYHSADADLFKGSNQYRLQIVQKNNPAFFSSIRTIFIQGADRFEIYPNPATNLITITGKPGGEAHIRLFDLSSRLISEKYIPNISRTTEFVLPTLQPGVYLLTINNEIKKLMVQ